MSNEITIEKIDAVIQRVPSATYAEAKQALIEIGRASCRERV